MRFWYVPFALCVACSDDPAVAPPAVDAGSDAPDSGVMCPPALGAPRPRVARPTVGPLDDTLRVNHIQLKATHNSYHLRPTLEVPDWNYSHAALDVQLGQQGVRGFELDLHWNAACGRFEVYHLGSIDELTTCRLFTQCLETIRTWSDAHPSHHPLFLHLEPKDQYAAAVLDARITAMEAEILSVFPREMIITPDEVRGASPTLAEAIRARGWPTLREARGRVLFYIDRTDAFRAAYIRPSPAVPVRPALAGRLAFVDSALTDPFAGILVLNNPTRSADIMEAVRANFIVRVFSWGATDRDADHAPDVVLATGAQIVSTDFPAMVAGVNMWVNIPGGTPSRCNPLVAPRGCTSAAIESLVP